MQGYPKNNLTLIITKNLNLCQIQIQYFSPTNLANYRERCKRKRIFIQCFYANSFKYCKHWKELNLPILL
nr:MAG TPA: hypothetical protein [Caudoviricetes sp.]